MPKKAIGVYLRRGSNVWWWHIKAPKDLCHLYTSEWAERCSLETYSLPEANVKATRLRAEWLERFARERKGTTRLDVLTPDHGRAIGHEALKILLADEKTRLDAKDRRAMLRPIAALGIPGMQGYAAELGFTFDESTPGAQEALAHYLDTIEGPMRAKLAEIPLPPKKPKAEVPNRYLRDVHAEWEKANGHLVDQATIKARLHALSLFEKLCKNPPLKEVNRAMGIEFRAWLLENRSSKTAKDRFTYVKSLLSFAHVELELLDRNPWAGLVIESQTEEERTPWTKEAIATFFAQPLFAAYDLPTSKRAGADAAYWIPLIGLFTGARVGELCQLQVEDIVQEQDIWCIDFNKKRGKRLKTSASVRKVPIHSELIRLGFLDYVQAMKEAEHVSLWPSLNVNLKHPSNGFSRWFNEVPRVAVQGSDFHCLRHNVRSALSEANVPEPDQDNIIGHTVKGSTGAKLYRHVPLVKLQQGVEAIRYPTFTLARTYPRPPK